MLNIVYSMTCISYTTCPKFINNTIFAKDFDMNKLFFEGRKAEILQKSYKKKVYSYRNRWQKL